MLTRALFNKIMSHLLFTAVMVASTLAITLTSNLPSTAVAADDLALFSFPDLTTTDSARSNADARSKALIPITFNPIALQLGSRSSFTIPLPNHTSLVLNVAKRRLLQNGDTQIEAHFDTDGVAIITFGRGVTFANINSRKHNYAIGIDADRRAILIDYKNLESSVERSDDMRYAPDFKPLSAAQIKAKETTSDALPTSASGKHRVTLLALYSSEFATGFASPITRINQMIAFTNSAYDRSGINIELQLAHAQQLAFDNSAGTGSLLTSVQAASGDFAGVPAIRNQYFADLVAVLPFKSSGGIGGIAYVNGDNANFAFSVSQFASFGSDALFAHEIGHNLGSGHERLSANPGQRPDLVCGGGFTGYACGHGNGSEGTIMSYLNDSAWSFVFSNPLNDCVGEPCGIPSGQPNAADNRTSFNITGPLVRDFRVDPGTDNDKDGIENDVDNCPEVKNSDQRDTDKDGRGDVCDNDDDNDNVDDTEDNCPLIGNPDQTDSDENEIGDACESDICLPVKTSNERLAIICL